MNSQSYLDDIETRLIFGENGSNHLETTEFLNYSPVVRLKYRVCQQTIRQYKEVVDKVIVKHYYPYKNLNGRCCMVFCSSTFFKWSYLLFTWKRRFSKFDHTDSSANTPIYETESNG